MKSRLKLKGRMKIYLRAALILGILLVFIDAACFLIDPRAGFLLLGFIVFYFAVICILMYYNGPAIARELISFATQYGQVQKTLLQELDIPYAVLEENGKLIWMNTAFEKVLPGQKPAGKPISVLFPQMTREKLPAKDEEAVFEISMENHEYTARLRKISITELMENSDLFESDGYEGCLIAMYLFDDTALKYALQENDNQSLAVSMVYLDNYEETLEGTEEVRRALLTALVDRKVNKYFSSLDGITKKTEKDKYMIILRKQSVKQLQDNKFELLEDVKTVNIGGDVAITLSIGVGLDGISYAQNYEFAKTAIDMALGRGGDQAVVKTPETTIYYGAKSQQVEKSTRVKARVKAHALTEIIGSRDRIMIMGHRLADVDSFGAATGIYRICREFDKEAHIVLNEITTSVAPLIDLYRGSHDYDEDMIINSAKALEVVGSNAALVVVDVNRPSITECPELLKVCKSIVVLDHHRQGSEVIENATLSYVEPYASSASEMVTELLQYVNDGIRPRNDEADCLYSGIMIDTNNFMTKTGVRTFEAAAYLRRNGADVTRVRKLFRENVAEYKAKADAVSQAEIYRGCYAISTCNSEGIESPTIIGAQAANELLNIKGIKASFIITDYQGKLFVSARSIDEVNVQVVMEHMGGGGHMNMAGCQFEDTPVSEGIARVKATIDRMTEEGELS